MYRTVEAAEVLLASATRDTWSLADAVLADVPSSGYGGDRKSSTSREGLDPVFDQLEQIVHVLTEQGITTPNGEPYGASHLATLRSTAMLWPKEQRQPEAAYRTHQEATSPDTRGGRALIALCAVARGEKPRRPRDIDAAAWGEAVARVREKRERAKPPRFMVAANDLRLAMDRRPNIPDRSEFDGTRGLAALSQIRVMVREVAVNLADQEWNEEERTAALVTCRKILDLLTAIIESMEGISDDAFAGLLTEEADDGRM
jgi:hypothetical protein